MRIRWYNALSIFLFALIVQAIFKSFDLAPVIATIIVIAGNIENDAFDKLRGLRSQSKNPERDSRIASVLYFLALGLSLTFWVWNWNSSKLLWTVLAVILMTVYNRKKIYKNLTIGFLMFLLPYYAVESSATFMVGIAMFFVTYNREYLKDVFEVKKCTTKRKR